ncbi:MAG: SurA N-terminal domain-containing protein [Desulfobacterales bacterium]|jgi:peptidyl-prolyl cis-trans isomerase SurA
MTRRTAIFGGRLFAVVAAVCMVFSGLASRAAFAEVVDRIVAVVNDDIILLSELQEKLKPYADKLESMGYSEEKQQLMLTKLRNDLLDKLIEERLTDQQVKSKGISVSEDEIDSAIDRIKEIRSLSDEQLRQALENEGMNMEAYRRQMREQLTRSKLLDYEIKSKIVVTEEDIEKYYEEHLDQYGGEKKYHLRTILMRVPSFATEMGKNEVRRKMENVYQQLKDGADFAEMARRYSESSLAADGGDLGFFKLKEMAPQFQEALDGKPEGYYTPIMDTGQGFQIFFIEEIVTTSAKSLKEVSAEIHNQLYQQRVNERFSAWIKELRDRSHIKVIQ